MGSAIGKIKENKGKTISIVVGIAFIITIFVLIFKKEKFAEEKPQVQNNMARPVILPVGTIEPVEAPPAPRNQESDERVKDKEVLIEPPNFNPDTRSIMAGDGFIPQKDTIPAWGGNNYGLVDDLDDGAGGNMGLHYNLCSPSCCSAQYPTPHKLAKDPLVCGREGEFVPSSITCQNSWQNSGCACLTKKQASFINDRGGNA